MDYKNKIKELFNITALDIVSEVTFSDVVYLNFFDQEEKYYIIQVSLKHNQIFQKLSDGSFKQVL